jgi:agmatine deiminase
MTKSCIINENRNPGLSLFEIETELKNLLGLRKIIWLEGIKGKDITDAHTDYYAKFSRPGEVLVHRDNSPDFYDYELTRQNIDILSSSTDADGNPLKLTIMDAPEIFNEQFGIDEFAPGYIGYYLCNGAVIAQKFGDENADKKAKKTAASSVSRPHC